MTVSTLPGARRPARAALRSSVVVAILAATAACASQSAGRSAASPAAATAAAPTGELVVVATTDVHGRVRGWDYFADSADPTRGLARAGTIIDSVRAAHPDRVVLVDGGDLLQGNPLTYVAARVDTTMPHPVPAAMNALRYDASAIGNHEFNYGVGTLARAAREARFPMLAANARTPDGRRAYPAWTMVERGGVKVAIVGATTPGSMVWDRDNLRGRVVVGDIVPEVRLAVDSARHAGAQVVVTVLHSGFHEPASYDTVTTGVPSENVSARVAREVPGIDVIVYGHSHKEVADTVVGSTLLVQPKNWAGSVAVATLTLESDPSRPGGVRVASKRGRLVRTAGHAEHAGVLAATQQAHERTVRYVTAAIGHTAVAWRADSARVADTPLIDFILEVERRAAGADLASTAAFSLDASLDSGRITLAEVARLYPYENTLRAVRISGRQLRDYLEHSARYYVDASTVNPDVPGYNFDIVQGVDYTIDLSRPVGQRITRLERNGRAVAPTDSFTMALNNYRQTGGGGFAMLSGAPVVYDRGQEIRQLLIDEVQRKGELRPEDYFVRNWRLEPAGAVASAYVASGGAREAERGGGKGPTASAATAAPARRAATTSDGRDRRLSASSDDVRRGPHLRIIATNDFHGSLLPRPDAAGVQRGGAAAMAAVIERARRECAAPACRSILLDGGDMFQGTPISNFAFGRPVVTIYDTLGYSASALGNHEFDWGTDTLRARMRQARYGILGANVRYADGRDVEWIRDDTLVTRGPWRIGVIGVATVETPSTTRAANVRGLKFLDPAPVVDSLARRLRARGADAIVVIAHAGAQCGRDGATDCGGEIIDLARRVTEKVDAIVSGHTHTLVDVVVNGIPIVQARSNARAVAVVDVPMRAPGARPAIRVSKDAPPPPTTRATATGEVREVIADSIAPNARVAALVRAADAKVGPIVNRRVAVVAEAMRKERDEQYALGNLLADAQRDAAQGDVAVMNNGGIRTDLPAGPVTWGQLFEIQPFGNTLYRLTVRGRDLRGYLERIVSRDPPRAHVSGVVVEYDPRRPAGQRLTSVRMADGAPLDDAREYRLVINDFLATGGDGLGLGERAIRSESLDIVDIDALVRWLERLPQPVAAPSEPRLIARP